MSASTSTPIMSLLHSLLLLLCTSTSPAAAADPPPTPAPWPLQFHSILYMNSSGALSLVDLWYDWPNGRNFNIFQHQLGRLLYNLEWNNGTSFLYTLDASRTCRTLHFDVGILRPNWLDGAEYLGQEAVDGFLCNAWKKVDFMWYYEDVATKRPVRWVSYLGMSVHVMTFEVGAVLEDAKWQAPVYCFEEGEREQAQVDIGGVPQGILMQRGAVRASRFDRGTHSPAPILRVSPADHEAWEVS